MGIAVVLLLLVLVIGVFAYYAVMALLFVAGISIFCLVMLFFMIEQTFGSVTAVAISLGMAVLGLGVYMIHNGKKIKAAEKLRREQEARLRQQELARQEREAALAIERECLRQEEEALAQVALAKAWHDRSLNDWKRVLFRD